MCLNSAVFKVIVCENRKLPFLCLKYSLLQYLHMNPKWTAMRHIQMVNVAKHTLSSNVFSPLFTQACKLLPGYLLFLLSTHCSHCRGYDMYINHQDLKMTSSVPNIINLVGFGLFLALYGKKVSKRRMSE